MPIARIKSWSSVSKPGAFIISLDFELHWGLFDHTPLTDTSRAYFDRTRTLIPPTLELFAAHGIAATWATVGMLFARNKAELEECLPTIRPAYRNPLLDPYRLLEEVGEDEAADPYHFAPGLIARVAATPGQVLGSHTFGHYYCLEEGQDAASFGADLQAAQEVARRSGYAPASALVFPRNQYRADYFPTLGTHGFSAYRGNPDLWFWRSTSGSDITRRQRAVRLMDNYVSFIGDTLFEDTGLQNGRLWNIPSSRFLRPYVHKIDGYGGQRLKIRRILREMDAAARQQKNYHLWWHPHNLATHPEKNMAGLREITGHYRALNKQFGWESHSMESYLKKITPPTP